MPVKRTRSPCLRQPSMRVGRMSSLNPSVLPRTGFPAGPGATRPMGGAGAATVAVIAVSSLLGGRSSQSEGVDVGPDQQGAGQRLAVRRARQHAALGGEGEPVGGAVLGDPVRRLRPRTERLGGVVVLLQ